MAKTAESKYGRCTSEGQLLRLLSVKYPPREYAVITQVRNGTGFARQARTADALALSLWPSRGLELHGFEVKCYRGDWTREKNAPEKAEEIAQYCDHWWIVAAHESVVTPEELPKGWGLLLPDAKAETLLIVKPAPAQLKVKPLTRPIMASMLRRISDTMTPISTVTAQTDAAYLKGKAEGFAASTDKRELERLQRIEKQVQAFEQGLGQFFEWSHLHAGHVGEATKAVLQLQQKKNDLMNRLSAKFSQVRYALETIGAVKMLEDFNTHVKAIETLAAEIRALPIVAGDPAGPAPVSPIDEEPV